MVRGNNVVFFKSSEQHRSTLVFCPQENDLLLLMSGLTHEPVCCCHWHTTDIFFLRCSHLALRSHAAFGKFEGLRSVKI